MVKYVGYNEYGIFQDKFCAIYLNIGKYTLSTTVF